MRTDYKLAYEVHHGPPRFMSQGHDVHVRLEFSHGPVASVSSDAHSLVVAFDVLASSGALGGRDIRPIHSDIAYTDRLDPGRSALVWRLAEVWLDDRAAVILAQMFQMLDRSAELRLVTILPAGFSGAPLVLGRSGDGPLYPPLYRDLESILNYSGIHSSEIEITGTFKRAPTAPERDLVLARVEAWVAAATVGAYANAPLKPEDSAPQYSGSIEFFESEFAFAFPKFRCHPEAVYGLANAIDAAAEDSGIGLASLKID